MISPVVILALQTLVLWFLVVALYKAKDRYTLIPLYSFLAISTLLTHNLTDLRFSIVSGEFFFLIGSVSFFTTIMFATLFLYLFEGPRAGRLALWTILGSSFVYIAVVFLLGFQADTSNWVAISSETGRIYFWSLLAVIFDVIFLAMFWELFSKIRFLPLVVRVFFVTLAVLLLDSLIFVTGVFVSSGLFWSILKGNILVRLVLSFIGAPIMTFFLKTAGFSEEKREKPRNFWEILNLRSDLGKKISDLEETLKEKKELEKELQRSKETYELVLAGSEAGIWDWDISSNKVIWSQKALDMLGYTQKNLGDDLDSFKKILHPDDLKKTFDIVDESLKNKKRYETEYRLKSGSGEYRWFSANGTTKYDDRGEPVRMVGTIIDIDRKKKAEFSAEEKMKELERLNHVMIGRELKMAELKKELDVLKK